MKYIKLLSINIISIILLLSLVTLLYYFDLTFMFILHNDNLVFFIYKNLISKYINQLVYNIKKIFSFFPHLILFYLFYY